MLEHTWTEHYRRIEASEPMAIVGSPGLRSIGKLVVDSLVERLRPELVASLYSTHFPVIYQSEPSYAPDPRFPGFGGALVEAGETSFPKVEFFFHEHPPLIITRGYHADFVGQYEVAEKVLDFYEEAGVRRMIVVAGYVGKDKDVCCAATDSKLIDEAKSHGIEASYTGPFYGFSGLVFGLAKIRGIEALCLFGKTEVVAGDLQCPDEDASRFVLKQLSQLLKLRNVF